MAKSPDRLVTPGADAEDGTVVWSGQQMLAYHNYRASLQARWFRFFFSKRFGHFGRNTKVISPLGIEGIGNIRIGDNVIVAYKSYLAAVPHTGERECMLEIGDGSSIGSFNHLYATKRVSIGRNVLTANNVYISDNTHGFHDVHAPVKEQPIVQRGVVEIGDGTWLGQNVCVVGAKIGRNCVVGSNSVVTKDLPDYCVAVGSPARIIRRFDLTEGIWKVTDQSGTFLPPR